MTVNKLKIHVESGNIYHNNTDTNESIYGFFENQEDETKKRIDFEFVLADDYEDYFMKYLVKNICSPIKTLSFCFITSMIT